MANTTLTGTLILLFEMKGGRAIDYIVKQKECCLIPAILLSITYAGLLPPTQYTLL